MFFKRILVLLAAMLASVTALATVSTSADAAPRGRRDLVVQR